MNITIATNYDDWEGIYINGVLRDEGHKLRLQDVLELLGHTVAVVDATEALEIAGALPELEKRLKR